jgi:hypothetical protein
MSSLNEGLELDDELPEGSESSLTLAIEDTGLKGIPASDFSKVVFDGVTAGEVPELSDTASVVTVVNGTEDLGDLKTSIINAAGMSKKFALEAERLIPGFINEERPVSFYTEFPSRTNYKLALEAIETEQKSLIKRIWDLIVQFFKNAIVWLEELITRIKKLAIKVGEATNFYSNSNTLSILEKAQAGITDPVNTVEKAVSLAKETPKNIVVSYHNVTGDNLTNCKRILNSFYNRINTDDVFYAIVSENPAIETLISIGISSGDIVSDYGQINKSWLEKALLDKDNAERNVRNAIDQIHDPAFKRHIPTFETYQSQVALKLKQRNTKYSPSNMSMKELCSIFGQTFRTYDMKLYQKTIEGATIQLKKLKESVLQFTTDASWPSGEDTSSLTNRVTSVIGALHRELRSLILLLKVSGDLFTAWVYMYKLLNDIVDVYSSSVSNNLSKLHEVDRRKLQDFFGLQRS